ncbi:glycosyltransferase family 4 protein [Nitrospiraceae bacterium AH_259_D15_M11_P09]|nr:glycosyltransferase family 4 protein [Nitrospiraceae bacterium AH_259_D15_M11_P09]
MSSVALAQPAKKRASLGTQLSLRPTGCSGKGKPIRVCFISPLGYGLYRPESGHAFGGAEVQFFLLACALSSDQEFEVSVLTTVETQPGTERYGSLEVIKRQGLGRLAGHREGTCWNEVKALRGYLSAFLDMQALLRTIGADVYLHAGAGVEVGAYALICRLLRRRFIYVVASSVDLTHPNGKVKGPLRWLYSVGLRLADAVICRSSEQQAWLLDRYGLQGVLIRTGHPIPTPLVRARGCEDTSSILWVGRIHPLKQPEMFLDLAERVPKEHFVMIVMPDDVQEALWRRIQQRGVRLSNVTVYERIPWNEVSTHLGRAKLLVNTSTYEGFPNTFVQAALHGIPILSWAVDPDSVLSREGIGICARGSFDSLVASTRQMCASPDLQGQVGKRAQDYARRYHDLNHSAEELKTLVRRLAKSPGDVEG